MARRRGVPRKKDKEAYEKALYAYAKAKRAYDDNQTQSNRHAWQLAMVNLLSAYHNTRGAGKFNPTIPFQWEPLLDLYSAMRTTVDGKDADLFHVDPSDRYDSMMTFAKEVAVAYVSFGKDKKDTQERKLWIMEKYSVSRSTLNEWIRLIDASDLDQEAVELTGMQHTMADHYREHKLKGRRRKLIS
jgi:hypothetical protein